MEYGIALPTTRWSDCALSLHIRVRGEERTSWLWIQLWQNLSVIDLGPGSALVMWTQHSRGITQLYWIEQHLRSSGYSQGSLPSTRVGRFSGFSEWDPVMNGTQWWPMIPSTGMGNNHEELVRQANYPDGSQILLFFSDTWLRIADWGLHWFFK